jgi:ferric-dicitrate binding protein FerR (iron transport regulator)
MNHPLSLIHRYLDGELAEDEAKALAEWLRKDRANVRLFVQESHLHKQLRDQLVAKAVQEQQRLATTFVFPIWAKMAAVLAGAALVIAVVVFRSRHATVSFATLSTPGSGTTVRRGDVIVEAVEAMALQNGDIVRTPEEKVAVIAYAGEATRLELEGGTEVLLQDGRAGKRVLLRSGEILATIAHQPKGAPMVISTPQAETKVIGTQLALSVGSISTWLEVTEGLVELTRRGDGRLVEVAQSKYAVVAPNVELAPEIVSDRFPIRNGGFETGDFNRWWIPTKHRPEAAVTEDARYSGRFGVKLFHKGRLDQVFDTVPGKTYEVTGRIRIDRELAAPPWGGLRIQAVDDTTSPWTRLGQSEYLQKSGHGEGRWIEAKFTFNANREHARLVYQNFGDGDFEVSVDDFSVSLKP